MNFRYISSLSVLIVLYFCIPKIDIFSIPGFPTGIRTQDLISFFILLNRNVSQTLISILNKRKIFNVLFFILYINFLASIYFSTILEFLLGWIRILQYLIVGIASYLVLIRNIGIFKFILLFQFFGALFQYFKIIPVYDPGRATIYTSEYAGSFGTAAELAYFCGLLSILMLSNNIKKLSFFALILPIFSGVRTYFLTFPVFIYASIKKLSTKLIMLLPILIIAIYIFLFFYDLLLPFFNSILLIISSTPPDLDYLKINTNDFSTDIALGHRIGKWATAISIIIKSTAGLHGTGLYSAGGALDGGLLRLFLELGIPITLFLFYKLIRIDFIVFLVFILINLFFDGYLSSVTMPLFFAYLIFKNRENKYV